MNLDRFAALMRGEIDSYQLEKRYLHKDGQVVWVNLTAALQRDQAGNPAYCIAIIEDIGERKRAERALGSETRLRRTVENAPSRSWCMPRMAKSCISAKPGWT